MNRLRTRPKALYLVGNPPFQPRSGYDIRVLSICRELADRIDQTIVARTREAPTPEALQEIRSSGIKLEIVHLPKPRVLTKIVKGTRFLLSTFPLLTAGMYFANVRRMLIRLQNANSYDMIVMEGTDVLPYWPFVERSSALKVLSCHNVDSENFHRQARIQSSLFRKWVCKNSARRINKWERRILKTADIVWATSDRDKDILARLVPQAPLRVAPNGVDCQAIRPLPSATSKEILFVGSLDYLPNIDAVCHFSTDIFPLIRRKIPDATFRIVGRYPGAQLRAVDGIPGIMLTGEVSDVAPYYAACALTVVPLRAGGGTRLKILESMAFGRAVISTALGAEGLSVSPGSDILICDQPPAFADCVVSVLQNQDRLRSLVTRARKLVEEKYSWSRIAEAMYQTYAELLSRRRVA